MTIDLDKFDTFFEKSNFLSKEFVEKLCNQSCEVKAQFVEHFASHFSLVTQKELDVYKKKLESLERKVTKIIKTLDAAQES